MHAMNNQQIAAVIQRHAAAHGIPPERLITDRSRTNKDLIPGIRAHVARELHAAGMTTVRISRLFRQNWTTTWSQIHRNKAALPK